MNPKPARLESTGGAERVRSTTTQSRSAPERRRSHVSNEGARREHAGCRRESDGRFSGSAISRLTRASPAEGASCRGRLAEGRGDARRRFDVAEMNEKRGAKDDRGMPTTRRLRSEKRSAMPPEFLLLSTAFVWGGYHPCMRMLLTDTSERGSAPTPSEINLARFSLVAALFVAQAICADAACFRRRARSGGASLMTTREETRSGPCKASLPWKKAPGAGEKHVASSPVARRSLGKNSANAQPLHSQKGCDALLWAPRVSSRFGISSPLRFRARAWCTRTPRARGLSPRPPR